MRKKFSIEITFLLILVLLTCMGGIFATNYFFKKQMIQQQREKMTQEIHFLSKQIDLNQLFLSQNITEQDKEALKEFTTDYQKRLTLLDTKGIILYDSSEESLVDKSESRQNRPEIQAVIKGAPFGTSLRYSETLDEELLYIAKPIKNDDSQIGIVRLSERYTGFSANIKQFRLILFVFVSILLFILFFLLLLIIKNQREPLRTTLPVLKNMIEHPEKKNTIIEDSEDWQELYMLVNELSSRMNKAYQTYTSNEQRIDLLLEDLLIGIFMIDTDNKIVLMNSAMKKMLHLDTLSKDTNYLEIFQQPQLIRGITETLQEKKEKYIEVTIPHPTEIIMDVTLRYIPPSDNQKIQLMGIANDITRIRQLEQMQQDFVSNVSHELKTPVTSILGFAETLLDGAKDNDQILVQFLTIIQQDTIRLQKLIQEILQLSYQSSHAYFESVSSFPKQMIQQITENYRALIEEKHLKIMIQGNEFEDFVTKQELLYPIFKNLIENAIQYSKQDGTISIYLTKKNKQLCFEIEDNGIGISENDQKRIFERFYRVDKARSRHSGGTGLGLSIVAHYTQLLGGTIQLQSNLGLGTKFIITLPDLSE